MKIKKKKLLIININVISKFIIKNCSRMLGQFFAFYRLIINVF